VAGRGLFCDLTEVAVDDIAAAKSVNDFYKKAKKQYPQVPQEILQQIYETAALKHADTFRSVGAVKADIGRAVAQEAWEKTPGLQKFTKVLNSVWNLPRSLTTWGDVPVFRQGAVLTVAHPTVGARNLVKALRAMGDESTAQAIDAHIRTNPDFQKMVDAGTYVQPLDRHAPLEAREEAFINTVAERIPGVGRAIRGSERAFATYMNLMRSDFFSDAVRKFEAGEKREITPEELKALGHFTNVATGRGSLGPLEASAPLLNQLLFSPRYAMSRLQYLSGQPLWGEAGAAGGAAMKKAMAKEYVRYVGTVAGTLAMTKMIAAQFPGSVKVEDDPRSSNFGKVQVGNTRFDLGAGLNQYLTFASRLATGKTQQAGKIVNLGERPSGSPHETPTRADLAEQQLRRKLAPTPGTIWSVAANKQVSPQRRAPSWQGPQVGVDAVGNPVTIPSAIAGLTLPMQVGDVMEAAKEDGLPTAIATLAANFLSMSTSTYPDRAGQQQKK